ncbi:MAG TPA: 50S ribosomal protein L32 [Nitrospiria bacterium]
MAHPKHKISKSRRDKRRTHYKLRAPSVVLCPQCQEPKLPHRVCMKCGSYKGMDVIAVKES